MSNINKIIQALSLVNSNKREETITDILVYILYTINEEITLKDIIEWIKTEFNIEFQQSDIENCITNSIKDGFIKINKDKYYLTEERKKYVFEKFLEIEAVQKKRFERFCNFIDEFVDDTLTAPQKKLLTALYSEYLYECFYIYGLEAINQFKPYKTVEEGINDINGSIIKKTLFKIDNDETLKNIFIKITQEYPKRISKEDLDFIENIAEKAENFFSLGLSKEIYEKILGLNVVDWTVILDTNIIYCLIGLDFGAECISCMKLIDIVKKYGFKIKFQYLLKTIEELKKKKSIFEKFIPRGNYVQAHISALLKSNKLGYFEKKYFEKKLVNSQTPHPSDIIELAQKIMKEKGIIVHNSKFEELSEEKEYLSTQYQNFTIFLKKENEKREEQGFRIIDKSPEKIDHDIFLREAILSLRNLDNTTLNDVRYFGLTLDKILFKYDKIDLSKNNKSGFLIPTFFSPTFLLEKLIKISPLETDDYKNAFINAVSSKAFEIEKHQSIIAQKTAQYFYNMGIENEELILHCLSDDMFLEEFKVKSKTGELDTFVQSEIGKFINKIEFEKTELEKGIKKVEENLKDNIGEKEQQQKELEKQLKKNGELETALTLYRKELEKINKKQSEKITEKIDTNQEPIFKKDRETISQIPTTVQNDKIINWKLLNEKIIIKYKIFNRILLIINIFFFIGIIITSIAGKDKYDFYLKIAPLYLGILTTFLKHDYKLISYLANTIIFLVTIFLIIIKFTEIWNIWKFL